MSRYDELNKNLKILQRKNILITIIPAIFAILLFALLIGKRAPIATFIISAISLFILPLLIQSLMKKYFATYRIFLRNMHVLQEEAWRLQRAVAAIYEQYCIRNRGEHFKRAYALTGKKIRDLERRLAVGMSREEKEVFVTCFVKKGVALRVTASIGSLYRCSPADNPRNWKTHIDRLGCDEIRCYHSHPDKNNHTRPSPVDINTAGKVKEMLGSSKDKLRSFIIYWNEINEWRILEYDDQGKYWLSHEFDVAAEDVENP